MAIRKATVAKKMEAKREELLDELWPDLDPKDVWHRKRSDGFITIPRCMSLILDMLNQLSNGNPLASTYLTLWCHTHDEMLVEVKDEKSIAFEAGFKGQRAVATWKSKMKGLKKLGFIDSHAGKSGEFNYVLLFNPFHVIKRHHKSESGLINKESYLALIERAHAIGASDLND